MNKSDLARLIRKFRSGEASEYEKKLLEEYWQQARNGADSLRDISLADQEAIKKETFVAIKLRLGLEKVKKDKTAFFFSPPFYKIAASLLILLSITSVWYLNYPLKDTELQASVDYEVQTTYGERRTVVLPDESTVVLNGNSKLRYSKNWSDQNPREVWIDGEGFFAVQHTQNHQKFIVHTHEGLNVEVLGTKFNVKIREHGSEVLLTEGKVKLNVDNKDSSSVYLNPGELATMKENKLSKRVVKDVQYTSWVKSKLVFDKTPLLELTRMLQDTYGLNVAFQDEELKNRQLSGEISSATADDILFAIAETFNIKVTKMDDASVIFSAK